MIFNQAYRGYPKGYKLKAGEVSKAQLALFKKRGVIEGSEPTGQSKNLTVAEVKEEVKSMSIEEAFAFTAGDERKTIEKLRDDLVKTA